MKKIFVHSRPFLKNRNGLKNILEICKKRNFKIFLTKEANEQLVEDYPPVNFLEKYDMGIVFGGDGSILALVQKMRDFSVPILPISAGNLGFLSEIPPEDFEKTLDCVLAEKCTLDARSMLRVRIPTQKKTFLALNEIVMGQSGEFRIASIRSFVDGKCLTVYRADGVIVATSTGSTAYSLSAGGPLMHPSLSAMILAPISPHSFTQKPLVLPKEKVISLKANTNNVPPLILALDGQKVYPLGSNDQVDITVAAEKLHFLRLPEEHYFKTIRRKLLWGEGNSESCEI